MSGFFGDTKHRVLGNLQGTCCSFSLLICWKTTLRNWRVIISYSMQSLVLKIQLLKDFYWIYSLNKKEKKYSLFLEFFSRHNFCAPVKLSRKTPHCCWTCKCDVKEEAFATFSSNSGLCLSYMSGSLETRPKYFSMLLVGSPNNTVRKWSNLRELPKWSLAVSQESI